MPKRDYTGLRQFCEEIRSAEMPIAWFTSGLKIVDIANPHAKEVASFIAPGTRRGRAVSEQRFVSIRVD